MKILVIEDNPEIKEIVDYILKEDGHEVFSCSDGSCLSDLDTIEPDLILMDDLLGQVRGTDLCLQLKNDTVTKNIPVMLMSAMPNLPEMAIKFQADAYIEKPFNIDVLVESIQRFTK